MAVMAFPGAVVLLALTAPDPELPVPVERAFARDHEQTCDFTRTQTSGDEIQVERFEENGGQPTWKLVSVDGEAPSKKRQKSYAAQAERRAERKHPARIDFAALAEPGSYRLESEGATRAVYRFQPLAEDDDDEKIVSSLVGRLTVDLIKPRVVGFEVTNVEPFSPALGVSVKEMKQTVEFAPLGPDGPVATRRIEVTMAGRAFGFKKISEHRVITFDQFDCH